MKKSLLFQILGALVLVAAAGGLWYVLDQAPADGAAGGGPMGMGASAPAPVVVAAARTGQVAERVEAVGTARARESVEVVAEVAGRIAAIRFEEGRSVAAGDVLIELDDARERAELREATAQLEDVRRQLARARQLLESRTIPQARVDELQGALDAAEARVAVIETRLLDRRIHAPFEGVVGLREVSPGAYVPAGQRITTLDDVAVIRIEFAVPERFLGRLRTGAEVVARSPAFGGTEFEGAVHRIDTRVEPSTRTVRVQAEFSNPDGRLRPGMFLGVEVILDEREAVLVAEEAVVSEGERHYVFIVNDALAHRRDVVLGLRRAGEVEVRSGLEPGARVIVEGLQRVRDGAPVRVLDTDAVADAAAS